MQSDQKACAYYEKAAQQGHAVAQCKLGVMYEKGLYIGADGQKIKSDQKACEYYEQAAQQGFADAQYNLGWMFEKGLYIGADGRKIKSDQKACEYYEQAAQQGHADAQYNLGWMFEKGLYIGADGQKIQSDQKACEYYEQAAQQGDAYAQIKLGKLYYKGRYCNRAGDYEKNAAKAFYWWRKAALNKKYSRSQKDARKHLQDKYSYFNRLTYSYNNHLEQTGEAYHYAMAQNAMAQNAMAQREQQFIGIFFDPNPMFGKEDNQAKNRLIYTLLLDDKDLKSEDKRKLLTELIKKNNTPKYFTVCLPSDQAHRMKLKELLETILETIKDSSIKATVKAILKDLVSVQSALKCAEQSLEDIINKQKKKVPGIVKKVEEELESGKFSSYKGNRDMTLVFVALQLKNLLIAYRGQGIDTDQPATRDDVDHFQSFNQTFGIIINDKSVKNELLEKDNEQLSKIYKELNESESDLREATANPSKEVSFEKALEISLNALYTGVKGLDSGYIQRKPTKNERLTEGGIRIFISLCHAVPGIGGILGFATESAKVIHAFHTVIEGSHVALATGEAIEIGETIHKTSDPQKSLDEQLSLVYRNLGGQAEPLIRVLIEALKQRFQPVVNGLSAQGAEKLGSAMVRHIETYLRSGYHKKNEKELVRTLIALCTYGEMDTKEKVKWEEMEVPLAQLISRFDLACDYVRGEATEPCKLKPKTWLKAPGQEVALPTLPESEPLGYLPAFDWEVDNFVHALETKQNFGLSQVENDKEKRDVSEVVKTKDGGAWLLIFDDSSIEDHINKDPRDFKPPLTIKQLLEKRVETLENGMTAVEDRMTVDENRMNTMEGAIKELQKKVGLSTQQSSNAQDVINQEPDAEVQHNPAAASLNTKPSTQSPATSVDKHDKEEKQVEIHYYTPEQVKRVRYNEAMIMKIWTRFAEHSDRKLRYYLGPENRGEDIEDRIEHHLFTPGMDLIQESALLLDSEECLFETTTFQGDETSLSFCSSVDYMPSILEQTGEKQSNIECALQQYAQWKENHSCLPRHCVMFPYHANENHWVYTLLQLEFSEGQLQPEGYIRLYNPAEPYEEERIDAQVQAEMIRIITKIFKPASTFQLSHLPPQLGGGKRFVRQQPDYNGTACGVLVAESGKDMIEGTTQRIVHGKYEGTQIDKIRLQHLNEAQDERFQKLQDDDEHFNGKISDEEEPIAPFHEVFPVLMQVLQRLNDSAQQTIIRAFIRLRQDINNSKKTDGNFRNLKNHLLDYPDVLDINLPQTKCSLLGVFFTDEQLYQRGARDLLRKLAKEIKFSEISQYHREFSKQLQTYLRGTQFLIMSSCQCFNYFF